MSVPCVRPTGSNRRSQSTLYRPPSLLKDLHILDVVELAGSQGRAAQSLAIHQSTVCRSLQLMQKELRLERRRSTVVRFGGHNDCLHHLRLAYRAHRASAGWQRLATDPMHRILLLAMARVQQVPSRFRSGDDWAGLVRRGVIDGAIVSSFALSRPLADDELPEWGDLSCHLLGEVKLELVAPTPDPRAVLLPRRAAMPLLHQTLERRGLKVEGQPDACQDPAAWIKRLHDWSLALPVSPRLVGSRWLEDNALRPLEWTSPMVERLWLLLPTGAMVSHQARRTLRVLRWQVARA